MKKTILIIALLAPLAANAMDYCRVTVPDPKGVTISPEGKIDVSKGNAFGASIFVGQNGKVSRYDVNPDNGSIMSASVDAYHYNDSEGHSITLDWDGVTVETVQFIPDSHRYLYAQQYMPDATAKSYKFKSSITAEGGSWHDCTSNTITAIYKYREANND